MSELGTFEAIISESVLVDFAETFQSIVQEIRLHVREDGLHALPVDPANVAMCEQELSASAFESYDAEPMDLGLNLETLIDYASAGEAGVVELSLNPETRKLEITNGSAELTMALIDPDSIRNDGEISDIWDGIIADVTVEDAAALKRGIDTVGMVSDHVAFEADTDGDPPVAVTGQGDTDDARVAFDRSLAEGSEVSESGESLFSEEYLTDMVGVIPDTASVRVRFGDEWPMAWDYTYPDVDCDVKMMCAPRIQSQ